MTTAITVYDSVKDPLQFVQHFGTMLAKSRMFGCENEAQGQVLAMACLAEKQNPIAIKRTYHIIDGNLSMRADAMLAELRNRGGRHNILERTAEAAEIEVIYQDQTLRERLTWKQAQAEPWPFQKDGKTLKKNWRTDRARRQMLWARVISEAVRTIAPEIIAGVYTPEEAGDFDDTTDAKPKSVDVEQLMQQTAKQTTGEDEPIDAEYEVTEETKQDAAQHTNQEANADGKESTAEQRQQLRELFDKVGANDEQIAKALERRGVKAFRQLSRDQADEMIKALTERIAPAGESRLPDDAMSSHITGPVDQSTIDQIKALMVGDVPIIERVQKHLQDNGKAKLAELSQVDGEALLEALSSRAFDAFFERSLQKPPF